MILQDIGETRWELDAAHSFGLYARLHLGEVAALSELVPNLRRAAQQRGDLYAEVMLRTRYGPIVLLAADRPERARRDVHDAMGRWSQRGFHIQHWWEVVARAEIALYSGAGSEARAIVDAAWEPFRRSLQSRIQVLRVEAGFLRARAALAIAATGRDDREPMLREAASQARRLRAERTPWITPMADLVEAGVRTTRGEIPGALASLEAARDGFAATAMALHAAVAERRAGQLVGGVDGAARRRTVDDWMAAQGIQNPDRIAALLAPGRWHD